MPCIQLYTNPTLRDVCLKTMINLLQTSSIGANIVHRNIVSGPHLKIVEGIDKATHMWKWTPSPSSTIKRPRVWNAFEGFCRILLFIFWIPLCTSQHIYRAGTIFMGFLHFRRITSKKKTLLESLFLDTKERRNVDQAISVIGMPIRPTLGIIPSRLIPVVLLDTLTLVHSI